ncbi:MAG: DsrE family protein [Planctomycetes bacterium]|nr:DsrE family protein [Planctomycetota bacterium]
MAGRFCVTLRHAADDPDAATMAFVTASAGPASGKETLVFLTTEGVRLAVKGAAAAIREPGLPPLAEVLENYLAAGGKVLACGTCVKKRGLAAEALDPRMPVAGAASLVAFLSEGAASVTF